VAEDFRLRLAAVGEAGFFEHSVSCLNEKSSGVRIFAYWVLEFDEKERKIKTSNEAQLARSRARQGIKQIQPNTVCRRHGCAVRVRRAFCQKSL
jgi:hypothetical protein